MREDFVCCNKALMCAVLLHLLAESLSMRMRTLLSIFFIAVVFTSCTKQPPANTNAPAATTTPAQTMATENEKLVRQYFEYFNKHEWSSMAGMYADVSDFKDPSLGLGIVQQTKQQIIEKYNQMGKLIPDINDRIVQLYPSGDKHIIVEFISTGSLPDGSKFELPICTVFTIENGRITKDYTYYDNAEESH
jgi:ketosteroid isomerase-like protein